MSMKLKKSDTPKGWDLSDSTTFQKRIYRKPMLSGRIWLDEDGTWRPKIEVNGESMNVWSLGQVFGPACKTIKAALAWVKRAAPKVQKKIKAAIAREKKKSLGCECP